MAIHDIRLFNTTFTQQPDSCVLSSYGIVTNYFTRVPVTDVFIGYCNHFSISYNSLLEAENKATNHLLQICPIKKWGGYDMIEFLHNHSPEEPFFTNSQAFDVLFSLRYLGSDHSQIILDQLREELQKNESLLNCLYEVIGGWHSITVGFTDQGQEFFRNTGGKPRVNIIKKASRLTSDIKEWIAYRRIA